MKEETTGADFAEIALRRNGVSAYDTLTKGEIIKYLLEYISELVTES